MRLELVEPSLGWADHFQAMVEELRESGEPLSNTGHLTRSGMPEYVAQLLSQQQGAGLQDWQTPMTSFWLLLDQREIIGLSRVRHRLTTRLEQHGGHIGFLVRPAFRRKGFGRRLLALSLSKAQDLAIDRALLTCDADNMGSRRIIECNCGVLEDEALSPETGRLIRRYWIDLGERNEEAQGGRIV